MRVKIEFTNGNIEVAKVSSVTIYREEGKVVTTCVNSRHFFNRKLENISRIMVDNEIIYDLACRKRSADERVKQI